MSSVKLSEGPELIHDFISIRFHFLKSNIFTIAMCYVLMYRNTIMVTTCAMLPTESTVSCLVQQHWPALTFISLPIETSIL
ncbi:hypothetical protein BLOT_004393 [Blomia tropicalis]|nr:hypothetical protein BLOT_004393 [Blomia tropicalis]